MQLRTDDSSLTAVAVVNRTIGCILARKSSHQTEKSVYLTIIAEGRLGGCRRHWQRVQLQLWQPGCAGCGTLHLLPDWHSRLSSVHCWLPATKQQTNQSGMLSMNQSKNGGLPSEEHTGGIIQTLSFNA